MRLLCFYRIHFQNRNEKHTVITFGVVHLGTFMNVTDVSLSISVQIFKGWRCCVPTQKEHLSKGAILKIHQALKLIWKVRSFCLFGTLWKLNRVFVKGLAVVCTIHVFKRRGHRFRTECVNIKFQVLPWPLSTDVALRKDCPGATVFLTVFPHKTTVCVF